MAPVGGVWYLMVDLSTSLTTYPSIAVHVIYSKLGDFLFKFHWGRNNSLNVLFPSMMRQKYDKKNGKWGKERLILSLFFCLSLYMHLVNSTRLLSVQLFRLFSYAQLSLKDIRPIQLVFFRKSGGAQSLSFRNLRQRAIARSFPTQVKTNPQKSLLWSDFLCELVPTTSVTQRETECEFRRSFDSAFFFNLLASCRVMLLFLSLVYLQ